MSTDDVRLHELCLLAGFYQQEVAQRGASSAAADQARLRLASLLREADRGA